jgi:DNA-binding NtrC family response regulator
VAAPENEVSILILDNEAATQSALQQVFDSEGWRVQVVSNPAEAMAELAREHWTLVLVNVALANVNGPLYSTLRELAHADAVSVDGSIPLRVLFMTPKMAVKWAQPALEKDRLPYVLKPFHLHDFLEKVSDLLLEVSAISEPIRSVKSAAPRRERRRRELRPTHGQMFASRDDYVMTEEELAEYERQEEEERKKRQEAEKRREML